MGFISGLYLKLSIRCFDFWIGWPYGGPILFMVWVRFMGLFSICVESWTRGLERPGSICCILGLWSPIYYIRKKPWTMINNSIIFVELHMRWDGLRVILRPQHLPHSFLQWSYGVDYDCSSLLHESIFHMNLPLLFFPLFTVCRVEVITKRATKEWFFVWPICKAASVGAWQIGKTAKYIGNDDLLQA